MVVANWPIRARALLLLCYNNWYRWYVHSLYFSKKANLPTRLQLQVTQEITNNLYKSCSHHRIHNRPCGKRPLLSMARNLAPIRCGGIMPRKKLSLLSVFTIGIKLLTSSLIIRLVRIGGIILNAWLERILSRIGNINSWIGTARICSPSEIR